MPAQRLQPWARGQRRDRAQHPIRSDLEEVERALKNPTRRTVADGCASTTSGGATTGNVLPFITP
jgi:hypothetical protein